MKLNLLIPIFFALPTIAQAVPSYKASQCDEKMLVDDLKENTKYDITRSSTGALASWNQDGSDYELDDTKVDSSYGSTSLVLNIVRSVSEKGADGRITKTTGTAASTVISDRKPISAKADFVTTRAYSSATEYVSTNNVVGNDPVATTTTETPQADGTVEIATSQTNVLNKSVQLKTESESKICRQTPLDLKAAKHDFKSAFLAASARIDALLMPVDKLEARLAKCVPVDSKACQAIEKSLVDARGVRDRNFFAALNPKAFIPPAPPKPQPAPSDDDGDDQGVSACAINRLHWIEDQQSCNQIHNSNDRDRCNAALSSDPGPC